MPKSRQFEQERGFVELLFAQAVTHPVSFARFKFLMNAIIRVDDNNP